MVSAISTTCSKKEFTETRRDLASSATKEATRLRPETESDLFTRDLAGSTSTLSELYATVAWRSSRKGTETVDSILIRNSTKIFVRTCFSGRTTLRLWV